MRNTQTSNTWRSELGSATTADADASALTETSHLALSSGCFCTGQVALARGLWRLRSFKAPLDTEAEVSQMHVPSSDGGGGKLTGRTRPLFVLERTRSLGGALLVGVDMTTGITELNHTNAKWST